MIEKIDPSQNIIKNSDIKHSRVWTTLITNTKYLTGLLTLNYSLQKTGSKYPLVALYTEGLNEEGHRVLDDRGILKLKIEYLLPTKNKDYSQDPRFYDCWSKLQPFSLVQFDKIVQLDSDMIVLQNMDELFELDLNSTTRCFAASHACVCNPYKYNHYPKDWIKENCAFTNYNDKLNDPNDEVLGPKPSDEPLGICNGGLQVVKPNQELYNKIIKTLDNDDLILNYEFADQSLLSDIFKSNWIGISYIYNYLKTLKQVHRDLDFGKVKNIHYILTPKPWDIKPEDRLKFNDESDTFKYWWDVNDERLLEEEKQGIKDGY
ncbi:hypothetical protein BN7_3937 [Wickerhamomyces ciferrii]|uniref:Uncharacterized protein n=1 Tax=Wickerhamomyces ciferrii (strain ATCC 14091 / BCRC 22168 / CBS 111 / JCM 3599 / NBRC 0793 / NRRL Y-1031 F-60-10) TaxID=1206466 RepID=K0KSP2_WICCF|nr:uncharacterized protein BN7_3937 [Wickerhamomyces ciferrii]CCH44374.1 hypothetical protein BN7_3937 [Wickerhamomyces ciferrii]